jgi:hypothetical protein
MDEWSYSHTLNYVGISRAQSVTRWLCYVPVGNDRELPGHSILEGKRMTHSGMLLRDTTKALARHNIYEHEIRHTNILDILRVVRGLLRSPLSPHPQHSASQQNVKQL